MFPRLALAGRLFRPTSSCRRISSRSSSDSTRSPYEFTQQHEPTKDTGAQPTGDARLKDLKLNSKRISKIKAYDDVRFSIKHLSEPSGLELLGHVGKSEETVRGQIGLKWLRENCRCSDCINTSTMQRKYNVFDHGGETSLIKTAQIENNALEVVWADSHQSTYPSSWLRSYGLGVPSKINHGHYRKGFFNQQFDTSKVEVPFQSVMDETGGREGMALLTGHIMAHGFCIIRDAPHTPEATESLLSRIGPIRNTHYGGFYDFTPDMKHADTAYTNLALAPHTDTTYFTEPAGLQAFHLLSHQPPSGSSQADGPLGGETILVDGFNVAENLSKENKAHYQLLGSFDVPWHASGNADAVIMPNMHYPVLEATKEGRLFRVRWNNDDRGVLPRKEKTGRWYAAAGHWHDIVNRPANQLRLQLEPGKILIFDNWRVLHGRTAFEGIRRMCGAYINRDDFVSRWRLSNWPRQEIIETYQTISP